ncbi:MULTISPECIES: hypothetical protein [unclassified Streptomyces]|uniref:hypothetical protein n=1 Tax=unclassified Streptomyces TaxID=2593676 RepID=UPI0011E75297|nr:hypothetical protein [Streptomyces sp. sk2.1]TXS78368.1 hypothetical protein EAO76_08165 [Streptomyces sp. sk2.1]
MRTGVRVPGWVIGGVMAAEVALAGCLLAGVRIPGAVLLAAEALVVTVFGFECAVLWRLLRAGRRAGLGWPEALRAALRDAVPVPVRRLVGHEARALHSLGLWLLRRRHAVPEGAVAAPYTGPQTAMMYGLLFVSVVETVMLALLVPWPLVHGVLLVVDVYGVVFVLALHASCVTRPHVVGADGALRIRYGGLFDLRVPAGAVAGARVERRFPEGGPVRPGPDGSLDLAVGGQTTVSVELTAPVEYVRPLGGRGLARTVRFHADDPGAVVAALTRGRTAPSPIQGPPGPA